MYSIDTSTKLHQSFSRPVQVSALADFLADEEIDIICRQLGHSWRGRIFTPAVTVRSMVYRRLHPDKSIRAVLADMVAGDDRIERTPATTSWCEARSRLPDPLWPKLIGDSTAKLQTLAGWRYLYFDRPVYLLDGSTISMPDTPDLVDVFGYANTKHGFSRFPVARITFITHAGTEAVVDYRLDRYRTGEDAQFRTMWDRLPDECILLCDRKFCSFYNLAKLSRRGIGVICPLHQRRAPKRLIADGKKLGENQWIVWFDLASQSRRKYNDPSLPTRLCVRLIRIRFVRNGKPRELWLVTTLLDHIGYPCSSIVDLYRSRWGIETRIGSLKTTLDMNVVPSKTAKGVRYDVAATILAHNLVWTLIHQAADKTGAPAGRISFAGTIKTMLAYSGPLRNAAPLRREHLYDQMLRNIARNRNRDRPGRIEPRLIKRQKKRYGFLKVSRKEARRNA
ncbi:MAG: IS4 family transposase [Phycisphaerae bacterium]|nr:IS4 family transposase [Phycisphaerae bacterium]